jgi:cytochrome c biogenesis protein CcmG/thiol:disulfide interchange protein DsbE
MQSTKTEKYLRVLIGLLVVGLIVVVSDSVRERVIQVGDKAPDFTIVSDKGEKVALSNFGGKLLVLNFWATWCQPCLSELPSLNAMTRRLQGSGVVVVGISVDKDEKAYKKFLERFHLNFATSRDPEANISAEYGTFKYPETYIIDANGRVVEKFIGEENWMSEAVLKKIQSHL